MTRCVGVVLHRRRSVIVVLEADGTELWNRRIVQACRVRGP